MSVRFRHTLGGLEADLIASAKGFRGPASRAVRQTAHEGRMDARRLARRRSGPHGKLFYKRITQTRVSSLSYEYGPSGSPKTEFVGAGYRNGGGNLDMAQSSDGLADKLALRLRTVTRETWQL